MSTTMLEQPVEDFVDTSDLDLLDDDKCHACCDFCLGHPPRLGELVKAICGRRVIWTGGVARGEHCEPCLEAYRTMTCPIHGIVGRVG